jgi:phenylalanyl-tRNA synthetase alpha chain
VHLTPIDAERYRRALALPDLTDAANGPHALQQLVAETVAALRDAWHSDVIVHRSHPVVPVSDNYDLLGYAPEAAARASRYTRYVTRARVLRTHTTALVPGLLRSLAPAGHPDALLVCPGLVYRRDSIDRLHVGEPHQLDLWRLRAGPLGPRDLAEMVRIVVDAVLPGRDHRAHPASHPYTREGLELEVRNGDAWVEVAECGVAAPEVLGRAGLDPHVSGLAMGIGLDRVLMLRKGIDDIRLLRSTDERVVVQMRDLSPYRPVSSQPPVHRDLSLAVRPGVSVEELGDRVRASLGPRAESVEAVELLSTTPADALPAQARERLGIGPHQENVLVRVTLRHSTRTLRKEEANLLRDEIYAALHEGRC